ncbi:hypothetical protein [Sorangium cellulosum]|nr:hypothetical protein [Sorangium cellulosum]
MILGKQDERTHVKNSGLFALLTPILQQRRGDRARPALATHDHGVETEMGEDEPAATSVQPSSEPEQRSIARQFGAASRGPACRTRVILSMPLLLIPDLRRTEAARLDRAGCVYRLWPPWHERRRSRTFPRFPA